MPEEAQVDPASERPQTIRNEVAYEPPQTPEQQRALPAPQFVDIDGSNPLD